MNKHEILDTPILDSFEDFLEEGEKIIWSGQPKIDGIFWDAFKMLFLLTFLYIMKLASSFHSTSFRIIAVITLAHVWLIFIKNKKKKQTFYALTPTKILFQFPNKEIHQIEFNKIDSLKFTQKRFSKKTGTIFILLKNPKFAPFVTYGLDKFKRRNHPTLEVIENIEEVVQLIQKGVEAKL